MDLVGVLRQRRRRGDGRLAGHLGNCGRDALSVEHTGRLSGSPGRRRHLPQHDLCGANGPQHVELQCGGGGGQWVDGPLTVPNLVGRTCPAVDGRQNDVRQELSGLQRMLPLAVALRCPEELLRGQEQLLVLPPDR